MAVGEESRSVGQDFVYIYGDGDERVRDRIFGRL